MINREIKGGTPIDFCVFFLIITDKKEFITVKYQELGRPFNQSINTRRPHEF